MEFSDQFIELGEHPLFVDLSELCVGFSEHRHEEAFLNCRLWCSSSYVDSSELGYL